MFDIRSPISTPILLFPSWQREIMGLKSALRSKLMRVYQKGFSKTEYGIFHANTINGYFYVLTLATKFSSSLFWHTVRVSSQCG